MTMRSLYTLLLGVSVGLAFLLGPLSHALIPHDHGGAESAVVWQSLHAALSHEKTSVPLPLICAVIGAILLVPALPRLTRIPLLAERELLRRGVHQYRRFG